MQKIVINNFGAIPNAEIEIRNILILIGEQASGKSTIAKLIYFFKSIRDELFNHIYQDNDKDYFDVVSDMIFPIREKFYDFFGSTFHLPDFEIIYYYDVEKAKYLQLTLTKTKKLHAKFSNNFLTTTFKNDATQIKKLLKIEPQSDNIHDQIAYDQNKYKYIQQLSSFVNSTFNAYNNSSLFVIAGRNATVSYSEIFEKYLYASVQTKIEDNKQQTFKKKEQTIDESLMLSFIERVAKIKSLYSKYNSFSGLIEYYAKNETEKKDFVELMEVINEILKGRYSIDRWGEKILLDKDEEQYVYLHNSSSGQQEVIRILQDIFLVILEKQKALRIIEEPEAHLFPFAQKLIVELLAHFANIGNELIITTHSPYVLTVFNNLLFANRVVEKNNSVSNEVDEIVKDKIRIDQSSFSAYSLTGNFESNLFCESIINKNTGLIDQNYLDAVSEKLSTDFNNLYSIHSKSFKRR